MLDRAAQFAARHVRTHEAARILCPSPRTLEKYRCHDSGLTFRKLGGRVVYAINDIEAGAEQAACSSTSDPALRRGAGRRSHSSLRRSPMSSRRLITTSERSKLDPFIVATGDASPRDQRDLMERPFFSLAKARRTVPTLYEAAGVRVEVYAVPEHGMATIWDADKALRDSPRRITICATPHGRLSSRFLLAVRSPFDSRPFDHSRDRRNGHKPTRVASRAPSDA